MSFPRYAKYKDSEAEWLNEVPSHWRAHPIKHVGILKGGAGFPHDEQGVEGEELPFFKVNALSQADQSGTLTALGDSVSRATAARLRAFVFPAQTLVLAKVGAALLLGRIRILGQQGCIDNNMIGIVPAELSSVSFLRYALSLVRFDVLANPGAVPSLNAADLGAFRLPTPPLDEQKRIACFLDRETASIDALVAEQQRLIELLKEKRQAVISHAVTKGLNPDAPMKASGIKWLGDVPAHWDVKRLKFVLESMKAGPFGSALTKDMYTSSGYRVYGQEQVIPGDFTLGDYFISSEKFEELSQYAVTAGDILVSCVGTFGKIAIVPADADAGIINPRLIRLRCTESTNPEYLVELLRSAVTFEQLSSLTRGGTMDVINIATLNEIFIAIPPSEEQQRLVTQIRNETRRFDRLTAEAEQAISLLSERRTALISAAVTGQIDVRQIAERRNVA